MSIAYDRYLAEHRGGVVKAFGWIKENLPELLVGDDEHISWLVSFAHDASKDSPEEYDAYDSYFYGNNRSYKVVEDFRFAWLHHIHNNPHHWQHWVLINDDPEEGTVALEMPYEYIIEMICDWWSFSWKTGDLHEIFKWYDEHTGRMILNDRTKKTVEAILNKIKEKLN